MASSSEKYPCPSDVKVGDFVPVKLNQFNYSIWRPMMLDLFRTSGILGLIDGTIPAAPQKINVPDSTNGTTEIENQDYKDWKRSDDLLRRWILTTVNADILASVSHVPTAKDMWIMIERRFSDRYFDEVIIGPTEEALRTQDLSGYLVLYNAALNGDWQTAEIFFNREPNAVRAHITAAAETALHFAVRSSRRNNFMRKLVAKMSPADLAMKDFNGATPLHLAAAAGNLEAAQLLVQKNPVLPLVLDNSKSLPLHAATAAAVSKRNMIDYLLTVTKEDGQMKLFQGELGARLLGCLIDAGIYDISLSLVEKYPELVEEDENPLQVLAQKHSAFPSGTRFGFWQRLIYSRVPVKVQRIENNQSGGDMENPPNCIISVRQKLNAAFWKVADVLVPQIKRIREKKLIHHQALELLKLLCQVISRYNFEKASLIVGFPLETASSIGNHEVVEEILASHPMAHHFRTEKGQNVFHLAIVNRQVNVFNLLYQFEEFRQSPLLARDASMNTGLHLVGYLESQHLVGSPETKQKLNLRSSAAGAALQMQRELQWFKEVKNLGLSQANEDVNTTGKTAWVIFSETHEELAKEAEQWMKDRANSCTIVAALIVTIVFAAVITVPSGNQGDSSVPTLYKKMAFKVFAVSDVLALFSSTSSMLMFLGILTSRYALEDFLFSLPNRFIIGLLTLFLSIIFMMIAFCATVYLVFADEKVWVLILVSALAGIPVTLFAGLQFRPLWEMIKSTYGHGVFGKQSDRILF